MKASEIYQSKYLSADDLQGRTPTLKIIGARLEKVRGEGNEKVDKIALELEGASKLMLVGKMSVKQIVQVLGDDTDDWIGGTITVGAAAMVIAGEVKQIIVVLSAARFPGEKKAK